jgi:thioredoxin-dependent peroxiredoxin
MWIPGLGKYSAKQGNRPGDKAPDFELNDHEGKPVKLSDQLGTKPVVLVFYPKANTPG